MAALSEIEKLEARWAENPDGRYFAPLADAYRKAGRVDDAIQVVTAGLNKHPDYLSAHIVLGRCLLEKKDDASARGAFERVLTLDTENIIALKSLAEIAERTGDTLSARNWLSRLLVVDAMNAEAAEDLARLGGPIEEEGGKAPEAPVTQSFIDFSDEPAPAEAATVPVEGIAVPEVPRTMERPAFKFEPPPPAPEPEPVKEPEPLPMLELEPTSQGSELSMGSSDAGPPLELEHASFQPPEDMPVAPVPGAVVPFDDQLAWGAKERTSQDPAPEVPAEEPQPAMTAPAIEFMGAAEPPPGRSSESDILSPAAAIDPNSSTLPIESVPPPAGWGAPVAPTAEAATIEMPPIRLPERASPVDEPVPTMAAAEPPTAERSEMRVEEAMAEATAPGAAGLPLIMPEDVTPDEEMRRPSAKMVQMVSPEPEQADGDSGEPMVTETMGDLYLRQGFKDQAADVYRRLLAVRPGDAGLKAKLEALHTPVKMSATAMGTEAVGTWLKRIARAQLHTPAAPPPAAPEAGPTPMEQAFAANEPEPAAAAPAPVEVAEGAGAQGAPGAPARPATDQYSLDQIFGGQGGKGGGGAPREPSSQTHTLGASFDEFFGSTQKPETVRPKEGGGGRQSEDDLSAFNAWLHGLKR